MQIEVLLSIIGSFLILGIGINGFFLRGIFQDLNAVRIELAQISATHDVSIERGKSNEKRIFAIDQELSKIRERLHSVEGAQINIVEHFKEN